MYWNTPSTKIKTGLQSSKGTKWYTGTTIYFIIQNNIKGLSLYLILRLINFKYVHTYSDTPPGNSSTTEMTY